MPYIGVYIAGGLLATALFMGLLFLVIYYAARKALRDQYVTLTHTLDSSTVVQNTHYPEGYKVAAVEAFASFSGDMSAIGDVGENGGLVHTAALPYRECQACGTRWTAREGSPVDCPECGSHGVNLVGAQR